MKWWKMEGRKIILPGYNVSVENDFIKERLIGRPDVILVVIRILKNCQIKQRNILVIKKTKAFKYGRFNNKESTFFNESYLNLFDTLCKNKKNRHLCLS